MNVTELFARLDGATIPGGCPDCDSETDIAIKNGVAHLSLHHDDDCPTWIRIQARR
ncbi:hypothetical protein [Nonomuraea rhizosphaerae]|uniref:hypothetical protein n=1 Tax=Nonomuraea rhizosphaerae TaxID=2665663 RepID=UPI001C5F8D13|nr:hypothetical protein [Nonomuraea rhizosphaerae]